MNIPPPPAAGLDLASMRTLLRAMAPLSYDRGMRFIQQAGIGLLLFSAGGFAALTADSRVPVAGLWLLSAALPYLTLRWWRVGLAPRSILFIGLTAGAVLGLAAALMLGLHGVLWGTLALFAALILLGLAARNARSAWIGLGPLRGLLTPSIPRTATAGETAAK